MNKSLNNHEKSLQKCSNNRQKNCLDFSTPGPKSAKKHDFPFERSFKHFQKNCLDFSDPMFKILQNPPKKWVTQKYKKCRIRGYGNALPPPPLPK